MRFLLLPLLTLGGESVFLHTRKTPQPYGISWPKTSTLLKNSDSADYPHCVGILNFNVILYIYILTHFIFTISKINPTRCTSLINIFIYFSSLHVSGVHVPIIRRKLLYLCGTGTCHSVWVVSGLQARRHPCRVTSASAA